MSRRYRPLEIVDRPGWSCVEYLTVIQDWREGEVHWHDASPSPFGPPYGYVVALDEPRAWPPAEALEQWAESGWVVS